MGAIEHVTNASSSHHRIERKGLFHMYGWSNDTIWNWREDIGSADCKPSNAENNGSLRFWSSYLRSKNTPVKKGKLRCNQNGVINFNTYKEHRKSAIKNDTKVDSGFLLGECEST